MIDTKRLIIRELEEKDAMSLSKYRSKEEVYRYQSWNAYSLEKACERIRYCQAHPFCADIGNYQLAVVLKDTNQVIGDYFLEVISDHILMLGYTFDSLFWGQGYASESLQALLQFLKDIYHFKVIICYVYQDNVRSIKLLLKQGFTIFERSKYIGDIGLKKILYY